MKLTESTYLKAIAEESGISQNRLIHNLLTFDEWQLLAKCAQTLVDSLEEEE